MRVPGLQPSPCACGLPPTTVCSTCTHGDNVQHTRVVARARTSPSQASTLARTSAPGQAHGGRLRRPPPRVAARTSASGSSTRARRRLGFALGSAPPHACLSGSRRGLRRRQPGQPRLRGPAQTPGDNHRPAAGPRRAVVVRYGYLAWLDHRRTYLTSWPRRPPGRQTAAAAAGAPAPSWPPTWRPARLQPGPAHPPALHTTAQVQCNVEFAAAPLAPGAGTTGCLQ